MSILIRRPSQSQQTSSLETNESSIDTSTPNKIQIRRPNQEPIGTQAGRYIGQVIKAIPYANPAVAAGLMGIDAISSITAHGAKQESLQELQDLWGEQKISEEQYQKAKAQIEAQDPNVLPSPSQMPYYLAEKTFGLPFEAKTEGQKLTEVGSKGLSMSNGGVAEQLVKGWGVATLFKTLKDFGVPENIAEEISLLTGPNLEAIKSGSKKVLEAGKEGISSGINKRISSANEVPTSKYGQKALDVFKEPRPTPQEGLVPKYAQKISDSINPKPSPLPPALPPEALGVTRPGQVASKVAEMQAPQTIKAKDRAQQGRELKVTKGGPDVGYRPVDDAHPTFEQKAMSPISKNEFESPTIGGFKYKSQIQENSRNFRKEVSKAYNKSKESASQISDVMPETVSKVKGIFDDLEKIDPLKLTPQQKKLKDYSQAVLKRLGSDTGYRPIAAQEVIDEVQNINQVINHTFEHGDPSGIFNPLKKALEEGVDIMLKPHPEAEKAWMLARAKNTEWHDIFDNEYINEYREIKNNNYEKLHDLPSTPDAYNPFQRAMRTGGGNEGINLSQIAKKQLVEKTLAKYFNDPVLSRTPQFRKDLNRLRMQLTPEEIRHIEKSFHQESLGPRIKGRVSKTTRVNQPELPKAPKEGETWMDFVLDPTTASTYALGGKVAVAKKAIHFGLKKHLPEIIKAVKKEYPKKTD